MTQISRRGEVHLNISNAFIKEFPVGSILTLKDFDDWGFAQHEYGVINPNSTQELNDVRNNLRKRVNNGGTADSRMHNECFTVEVLNHGKDYEVREASKQMDISVKELPRQMKNYFNSKKTRINTLTTSSDFDRLPPMDRIRIELLEMHLDETATDIANAMARFNREWNRAQSSVKKLHDQDDSWRSASNGGVSGFILEDHTEVDD